MRIFTFVAILITLSLTAMAKHVDLETAKSVAATFWENNVQKGSGHKSGSEFYDITAQTEFSNIYILNTNGGFVIVSSDDAAKPILGYSRQGEFNTENIPINAKDWLRSYCNEIQYAIDNNIEAGEETSEAWNKLRNGLGLTPKSTRTVSQLLTTNWNQAPYYNNLCPFDEEEGELSVTGCVATAMAQVMKYWNWPAQGTGSHSYTSDEHPEYGTLSANFGNTTYDWDNMPNYLSEESSSAEINAVATLMYHCGVSVEMIYSANASGAYTVSYYGQLEYCSENALRDYFGYSSDLYGAIRSYRYLDENGDTAIYEVYTYSEWIDMLKYDLDASRPILYTGNGEIGGHAFVFDGYDENELFHVNWGWGGYADGYFSVDALEPDPGGIGGGDYLFNTDHTAVFGVEPATAYYTVNVLSISNSMGTANGGGNYMAGQQVTISATANEGYRFTQWNDGNTENPRTITVTGNATYTAMFAMVTDIKNNIDEGIDIFPNPTTNILNITSQETISKIEIVNLTGEIIKQTKIDSNNATCNISDLSNGMYFVRIYGNESNCIFIRKLIKE
ncbi:MAG: thiol protease/hemagglutinin PrtT [Bacteroidales bacterium]|nr:thiol protease/hemagglutinin PrtT [Bacteroidales bacterium]